MESPCHARLRHRAGGSMNAVSKYEFHSAGRVDEAEFKSAMRNVAGSVSIVATGQGVERRGLTVTACCSLSIDPPSILVCVNRSAEAHDFILKNGAFSWNVLSAQQVALAERFAAKDGSKGEIRFLTHDWRELITGAPILEQALSCFDCRVVDTYETSTHTVFIGAVVAETHQRSGEALVYVQGRFAVPNQKGGSVQ